MKIHLRLAAILIALGCVAPLRAEQTEIQLLSGKNSAETVEWEFKVSGGRRSGEWSRIAVPSNWEMQGFGTYRYHCDWLKDPAPDHTGWYRHTFEVPAAWKGKAVKLVFGGVMTDTEVTVNGRVAGPVHQGGFYEFGYDVSPLLEYGGVNRLEVTVKKFSADRSVNRAERQSDYWLFGGIFRPVWLEARPPQHIERTAIDAKHTGGFAVDVYLGGCTAGGTVVVQVEDLQGGAIGPALSTAYASGASRVRVEGALQGVKAWSAEWPHRYRARIRMEGTGQGGRHEVLETFGFRTVELRPRDGLYVNGEKVRLKGSNRHTIWPTTGRATHRDISIKDVLLMKEMNMNAVRMSHYPPDSHFLEAADEYGLYVIDELAGWQKAYDTEPGAKLVPELVQRDVNHPSVIIWANGNEGGNNHELVPLYAQHDPQARPVIHPWHNFNGINTAHYEKYDAATGWFFHGRDVFMPTEFLHGNYDGGHAAGLEDWWNLMLRHPLCAGGFLWAFADEGIVRADRNGKIDTEEDSAPDGIVGPFREKEGSFFAIKEIWSPVYFEEGDLEALAPTWDGRLRVHNRYDFTDLSQVAFSWEIVDYPGLNSKDTRPTVALTGVLKSRGVAPGDSASLQLELPAGWSDHDGLRLTARDPHGREIYTWTWMLRSPEAIARSVVSGSSGRATGLRSPDAVVMTAKGVEVTISAATGQLVRVTRNGAAISLENGPRIVDGEAKLSRLVDRADGADHVVEAEYEGDLRRVHWRLQADGWLRMDYAYRVPQHAEREYFGVTFDYPETLVISARWLGKGPYRVWKNRLKGVEYGVWEKDYNDTLTGASWQYPEFKGFHANLYWIELATQEGPITIVTATEDLYVRLFTPAQPEIRGPQPRFTRVAFPPGDLSFLHGIAPIGNRFHPADAHGPAGQPNMSPRNGRTYEGTLFFRFGR